MCSAIITGFPPFTFNRVLYCIWIYCWSFGDENRGGAKWALSSSLNPSHRRPPPVRLPILAEICCQQKKLNQINSCSWMNIIVFLYLWLVCVLVLYLCICGSCWLSSSAPAVTASTSAQVERLCLGVTTLCACKFLCSYFVFAFALYLLCICFVFAIAHTGRRWKVVLRCDHFMCEQIYEVQT